MSIKELKTIIKEDYYVNFKTKKFNFFRRLLYDQYKFYYYYRLGNYYYKKERKNFFQKILFRTIQFRYIILQSKLSIDIPLSCNIGRRIYFPHLISIVIHHKVKIGNDCIILQNVTIGSVSSRGIDNVAIIGNNVMIGAGAILQGPIFISDNVKIGANSVVTKSISKNDVVVGIPAKTIKKDNELC